MSNLQPLNAANRREAGRRSALEDYLCLVDLGENRSAMLLDVSETGIGLQSVEGIGEGFSTTFRFQLPDTAVLVEGEGEIAWVDRAGRMGVRFTNVADELKPELRNWVASEANPLFAHQPETEETADLDARDRVAQLEARIIVSGWAQIQALNFLVDQIAAMTQASGVAIAVEDGSGIVCKASSGIAPQTGVRVNPRSGLSWECVRTKEVVTCVDTENDPRVDRLVCRELNMRSAMLVPVIKDHGVAGLVEVFSSRPHAFSNQTVILLKRVAEAVASLDETAPDVSGDSILQMPVREVKPPSVAPAPVVPPPAAREESSAPVGLPSAKVAAPAASAGPNLAAPVAAPVTPKPVTAPVTVPTATAAPRPATVSPVAPSETRLGVPFAQEVAAAAKAVPPPPAPRKVEKPAVVVTTASAAGAAPKLAEVAPVSTVVKPVDKPAVENPIAMAKPQPAAPSPAKEKPAFVQTVVAEPAVEKPTPVVKAVEVPLVSVRIPSQAAPLPAVAFSGAAASAATTFEVTPAAKLPHVVTADVRSTALTGEEAAGDSFADSNSAATPDRRRTYIGIAAGAMIAVSAAGGWYLAHRSPAAPANTPAAQSTASQTAAVPAATPQPASAPTAIASAPAPSPASPSPSAKTAAPKQPGTTIPAAVTNDVVKPTSQPDSRPASAPITAQTFVPTAEPPAQAPSIPIAPPNTAGMASLLSGPVAAPTLSRTMVSQGVTGGKQILKVQPTYPSTARVLRLSGVVSMTAHIAKNGSVTDIKILKGHPLLNPAAVDAVKRWKYEPFLLNGQPIENDVNVQVKFDIPR